MRKAILLFILSFGIKTAFAQDTIPPVITLNGNASVMLGVLNKWVDPGVMVTDNIDKNVSYDTGSGTFYATFPDGYADQLGTYVIYYVAKDGAGNKDSVARTIIVKDTIAPHIGFYNTVFCTHDYHGSIDDSIYFSDNFDRAANLLLYLDGCIDTLPGIYKYKLVGVDKSGNRAKSNWHYRIVKAAGDNSPCVLTDSLKDTCARLTSAIKPVQEEKAIKIYPNPANNTFRINASGTGVLKVKILELSGKLYCEKLIQQASESIINTSEMQNGIYVVEVVQNGKKYFSKLVVMH